MGSMIKNGLYVWKPETVAPWGMNHFIYFNGWLPLKKGSLSVKINYFSALHFFSRNTSIFPMCVLHGVSQMPEVPNVPFLPVKISLTKFGVLKMENKLSNQFCKWHCSLLEDFLVLFYMTLLQDFLHQIRKPKTILGLSVQFST